MSATRRLGLFVNSVKALSSGLSQTCLGRINNEVDHSLRCGWMCRTEVSMCEEVVLDGTFIDLCVTVIVANHVLDLFSKRAL